MTAPVTPLALTTAPAFPALADRAAGTYNSKAYDWATHWGGTGSTEMAALAAATHTNAVSASEGAVAAVDAAAAASAAQTAAEAASTATAWVSGATYAVGDVRWSPATFASYRRTTAGAGTTDPSLDAANWVQLGAPTLAEIPTPTNTSPANAATAVGETPVLTGSAFASLYSATHANTQVQVHTSNTFTSPLYDSGSVAGSVSVTVPAATLAVSTSYFWRMRYKNSRGTWSEWSTATSFTTAATFNAYIATPTATPAAFGDALEGGFYAGMVWNELVQTATSTTIGTGSKVFTVASMNGAPIVYAGQTLEVRSRANPANKMIGTVTGAIGTSLTINVTSVGGSGTFTDWSVMAQYRVIVAPKASGENTAIAYKNANSAAPSACGTLSEGRKATLAMVAADTAAVYPAAHWCNNLNIAGKTDWYLPARDELELCWRNLKPTADANYVANNRPTAATPNYMNLGSYGDTANTHGLNNNTSPAGSAHISGAPAQVAAGKNFRTGEAEAFAYGSFYYWSASEYSASDAWHQYWHSSVPGYQNVNGKANAGYVRAVRRSII